MPYEDDWLHRQIRQIAQVVARLVAMRDAGQVDEAHAEADLAARVLIGLDLHVVTTMPLDGLLQLLGTPADPERVWALARLVDVDASLHEADRGVRQLRALELYAEAGDPRDEGLALADALAGTPAARKACFRVHRNGKRWSAAEDDLFDLVDARKPDAREQGIAFYGWLLAQTDDVLVAGDLPRDEVEQGLAELLARFG